MTSGLCRLAGEFALPCFIIYYLFELIPVTTKPAELMRRRRVEEVPLAASPQAASPSGSLSQTLCSAFETDLTPLRRSFKDNRAFLSAPVPAAVD